jgi:hypothetical protein
MKYELKNEMTKQEVFDYVSNHLLTQNKRSVQGYDACAYRGDNNTSCAIGCMIKNNEYLPTMEGLNISQLLHKENINPSLKARLLPHENLLCSLQVIHDMHRSNLWKVKLTTLANEQNLTINF